MVSLTKWFDEKHSTLNEYRTHMVKKAFEGGYNSAQADQASTIAQLQIDNAKLLAVVQSLTLHDDIGQELWTTCFSATELDKLCVLATKPTEYNPLNEGK